MYVRVHVEAEEVLEEIDDEALVDELDRRNKADGKDRWNKRTKSEIEILELAQRAYADLRRQVLQGWIPPQDLVDYFWHAYGWSL